MGTLCTECGEKVEHPAVCWNGGYLDGEPIHERCIQAAGERLRAEATQTHRDELRTIEQTIDRMLASVSRGKR